MFNEIIERYDPDLILSERGDSLLFPALLQVARREKLRLLLDRDRVVTERKIETEGRTYFSYGNIIYKPPSYPLFGRWHIDRENSFAHTRNRIGGLAGDGKALAAARAKSGSPVAGNRYDLDANGSRH